MRRDRFAVLVAAGALGGALGLGASLAVAAPSEQASCVAKYVHEFGPPGLAEYGPLGGEAVSEIAHRPKDACFGQQETS